VPQSAQLVAAVEENCVMLDKLEGRNGTQQFAHRSMKNLDFMIAAAEDGEDVHPITATVGALLALMVFPWERNALDAVTNKRLPCTARSSITAGTASASI